VDRDVVKYMEHARRGGRCMASVAEMVFAFFVRFYESCKSA
jgi:hypothetical protein